MTAFVTSWEPPPAKVAVAVNCRVALTAMEGFAGVTAIEAGAAATSTTEYVGLYVTVQSRPAGKFGKFCEENWPVTESRSEIVNCAPAAGVNPFAERHVESAVQICGACNIQLRILRAGVHRDHDVQDVRGALV